MSNNDNKIILTPMTPIISSIALIPDHMICGPSVSTCNVRSKTCIRHGCKTRPIFNHEGESKGIYCVTHKLEGMVDVKNKSCIHHGCKTLPTFNREGNAKAIYCVTHKLEGMVDVVKIKNNNIENIKIENNINNDDFESRLSNITENLGKILKSLNDLRVEWKSNKDFKYFDEQFILNDLTDKLDEINDMDRKYDMGIGHSYGSHTHNTFFKYCDNKYTRQQILSLIFFILNIAKQYNGFAFGGIVRDYIIPYMFFTKDHDELDFKDCDVWFSKKKDAETFIRYLSNTKASLYIKSATNIGYKKIEKENKYPHVFERYQYVVNINGNHMFIMDIIVSEFLPVNDAAMNLLLFKPKSDKYLEMDESWFEVGKNHEEVKYFFTVKNLIISCGLKKTILLNEYLQTVKTKNSNIMRDKCKSRIDTFIKRGFAFQNYQN